MPTENAIDVIDCQVGLAVRDGEQTVAIRFFDPNGETVQFALPGEVARKLAMAIRTQLKMLNNPAGIAKH